MAFRVDYKVLNLEAFRRLSHGGVLYLCHCTLSLSLSEIFHCPTYFRLLYDIINDRIWLKLGPSLSRLTDSDKIIHGGRIIEERNISNMKEVIIHELVDIPLLGVYES